MLREFETGQQVVSVAISSLGVGTILHPSFTHATVVWPDGTWSKERYQDLVYVGESAQEPLPLPTNELISNAGSPQQPIRSNEDADDGPRRLDETPDYLRDNPRLNPDTVGSGSYEYGTASLNPEIFKAERRNFSLSAPLVPKETWSPDPDRSSSVRPEFSETTIRQELLDDEIGKVLTNRLLLGRV